MSKSEFVEDLEQEEFDTQMRERERELVEELQVLQEFYTQILLLCLIDRYIEASVEDSKSLDIAGASMDTPPQDTSIAFIYLFFNIIFLSFLLPFVNVTLCS